MDRNLIFQHILTKNGLKKKTSKFHSNTLRMTHWMFYPHCGHNLLIEMIFNLYKWHFSFCIIFPFFFSCVLPLASRAFRLPLAMGVPTTRARVGGKAERHNGNSDLGYLVAFGWRADGLEGTELRNTKFLGFRLLFFLVSSHQILEHILTFFF